MVEAIAQRIAEAIKRVDPERTSSIELMKFALIGLINTLITIILIASVGLMTKTFFETMLGYASFAVLRFFAGGLHMKNAMHCSLLSTILISIAPHITLSPNGVIIINIISIIIISILAPANMKGHARIPEKYFLVLKVISIAIVSTNFALQNSTISIVFFIQALTLIPISKEVRT